ncbi:MAG TPA: aspartyl/asparaginyl beta-hydroxylase domain-containing protein [Allosphingosinicella sp.]|nr:aspartyl/asparaginyl beta-hydroxylase domain-containing protein [Allosphingosinicella sp.]
MSAAARAAQAGPEPNFLIVAEGLDVAPALAELAALPDYYWLQINDDRCTFVSLLDHAAQPAMREELPETWRLIDGLMAILAAAHGDAGRLDYCRVGRMPPGEGLAPHFDGVDGILQRRYQLALQAAPGVALTVGGETREPRPGDAWRIAAHRTHSVYNRGPIDRITLLFDTISGEVDR